MQVTVYLGLGANLGDRARQIRLALAALEREGAVRLDVVSRLFETDAVADHPQPPYVNAVARGVTVLPARQVLLACLDVEHQLGRERPPGIRQAARTIDIDLLLYGDSIIAEPDLVVPHPRLLERPFVRIPLAEVAEPGLRHPETGEPLDVASPDAGVRAPL